jgi:hypothetical protein
MLEWKRLFGNQPYRKVFQDLPVHPTVIEAELIRAKSAFSRGDVRTASSAYRQAVRWVVETDDPLLSNRVCWFGSMDGFARAVLPAGERAVALAPQDGGWRDTRGLARALAGDYQGAIDDFTFFLKWAKDRSHKLPGQPDLYKLYGPKRKAWIATLKSGRNPFDSTTLKGLRKEE